MRWGDVDWERSRLTVRSPKTEHHEGGESRQVPLFPELRPYLEAVWEQAEPGTEHVISRYRDSNSNLRTQLERILRRAGLEPWPKLFQNLRSTRETELAETFPIHVVCAWIGNSQPVAAKHYLQVRDEDFDRATLPRGGAESGALGAENVAQNQAQPQAAPSRHDLPEVRNAPSPIHLRPAVTEYGEFWQHGKVPPVGLEPTTL